jgi:hypothetical protein
VNEIIIMSCAIKVAAKVVCALPRTKMNEQTEDCGLNYVIKIKSGILRSVPSINTHDFGPDFWVRDSLRL